MARVDQLFYEYHINWNQVVYSAYGKAGNGNEMETGNGHGTKMHQSLLQCFLHTVEPHNCHLGTKSSWLLHRGGLFTEWHSKSS